MVEALAQDVELGATEVGAGDKVSADEGQIRRTLLAVQRLEQALYARALNAANRNADVVSRMRVVRGNLDKGVLQINGLYVSLSKRVAARSAKVRETLRREKRNIALYKVRMNQYEQSSRGLASTVGYQLIRRAQTRLSDVVLEADLGLVDVAWQRKQDKAKEIQRLNAESKKKIERLDKTLESLSDNEEDQP